jgi:rhodanese-related sulfurtransferase
VVTSLRPNEVADLLRDRPKDVVLLDVRELDEREVASIDPSIHIPMNDVAARIAEIPKDRRLIVYCHHGGRSLLVASYLEGEGFRETVNLDGGIDAWSREVNPSVPRYS